MPILPENILAPIAEDNPCGEPATGLKNYEKIRESRRPNDAAIEAFLAPREDGSPRIMTRDIWMPREVNRLVDQLSDLIAARTKDLELAVWLVESLVWKHGFAGLAEGLALVHSLIDQFWGMLHPLPDEGDYYMRLRHLEWLGMTENTKDSSPNLAIGFVPVTSNGLSIHQAVEARGVPSEAEAGESNTATAKRSEAVSAGKTTPEDFNLAFDNTPKQFYKDLKLHVATCRELVQKLDELCEERFAGDPPGFGRIRENLEKAESEILILLRRKLEKDPDPVDHAALAAAAAAGSAGEDGAPGVAMIPVAAARGFDEMVEAAGEVSGLEPSSLQEAIVRIAVAARFLRRQNPASPMAYMLMRGLRWGELSAGGDELATTLLAAPSTEVRTTLKQLAANGAWPEVLELTEAAMATECGRGWLDLQRYAVRACEEMGFDGAARAVRLGVKHLLEDFPALNTATLMDDTGAANPETAAWLQQVAQPNE
ncbi:MAG: type VI secretion system protein TssA [Acidobacteria bacterium]|nr:type VI secretion system protein TssA [Acidobacteriota bacterium]